MTLSKGMKELERFKAFYDNHNWYLPVNLVNFEVIATELCCLQIIKEKNRRGIAKASRKKNRGR